MVFAKTKEAHRDLSLQFEKREVSKHYLVLVEGQVQDEDGRIDDGAIDMRLRRQVHDRIRPVLLQHPVHFILVADINMLELITAAIRDRKSVV